MNTKIPIKIPIFMLIVVAITIYQLVVGIIELNKPAGDDYSEGEAVEITIYAGFRAARLEHKFFRVIKAWNDYYYLVVDKSGMCKMLVRADSSWNDKFNTENGFAKEFMTVKGIVKTAPEQISDIIRQKNYSSDYGVSETLYIDTLYERVAWCRIGAFAGLFSAVGLFLLRYRLVASEKIRTRGAAAVIMSSLIGALVSGAVCLMTYVLMM